MTCFAPTSAHDALDVHRMALFGPGGLFVRDAWLCRGCRDVLVSLSMDWREERRVVPVRTAWPRLGRVA